MKPGEQERRQFRKEVRDHLATIVSGGIARQQLAEELRVTKQAISSYMRGRTTPKPHILRRLLAKWPHRFKYRGAEFGPEAFGAEPEKSTTVVARQERLFDMLSAVKKENVRVEVERSGSETELRLIVKVRA